MSQRSYTSLAIIEKQLRQGFPSRILPQAAMEMLLESME